MDNVKTSKAFRDWWSNRGSEEWDKALEAEEGTLGALEMVFTRGVQAVQKDMRESSAS